MRAIIMLYIYICIIKIYLKTDEIGIFLYVHDRTSILRYQELCMIRTNLRTLAMDKNKRSLIYV